MNKERTRKRKFSFKYSVTLGPAYNEFGYNEHLAITTK